MSFFGVLVNPWAPTRSDAAFCSLGRATINLLARRQPPFHSRDGWANQPHAAAPELDFNPRGGRLGDPYRLPDTRPSRTAETGRDRRPQLASRVSAAGAVGALGGG